MRNFRTLKILTLGLLLLGAWNAIAGDMKVMATLIWGTDEEHPNVPDIKPASTNMVSQFREVCKWKHYFEITNTFAILPENQTNRVRLSPKCEVDVSNLGKMGLGAKFYGEGKLIWEGKSIVEPGKPWGIGGGGKDATAWFVILTPQAAEKK